MFRSLSLAAVLAAGLLEPTPAPTPASPGPAAVAGGAIVDLVAPIVDLELPVAALDLSLIDADRRITLAADVLFAFDKADLSNKARTRIEQAAELLKARAAGKQVAIDGHTDAKGGDAYNAALSRRRAEAVRAALEPLLAGSGITFVVVGHGASKPVAPNTVTREGKVVDSPKGRARNRRVEITIAR
ncbi:OmpA family protein [Nonomuraea sp. NPDC050310]|uniref:OmpA family protein n=1 Tax=Nonomuraea sp. NPDC050310 TaxID=3154935 RepID=UPI0033F0E968